MGAIQTQVLQEIKLSRGSELCRVSIGGDFQLLQLVVSYAKPCDGQGPRAGWEASIQIDLPNSTCCGMALESLVAMKLREGFIIQNNYCTVSDQFEDQPPLASAIPGHNPGILADQPYGTLTALPGNTLPQNMKEKGTEDYYADFDISRQVQKERKGGTSIFQLAQYFHYPINEAAKLLDICPTVLKKICRRHGLRRWPHRKLKSINKSIEKLEIVFQSLQNESGKEHQLAQVSSKLSDLKGERAVLCFDQEVQF